MPQNKKTRDPCSEQSFKQSLVIPIILLLIGTIISGMQLSTQGKLKTLDDRVYGMSGDIGDIKKEVGALSSQIGNMVAKKEVPPITDIAANEVQMF